MKDEFVEIMREPGTGADLALYAAERRDGEVWEGTLRSAETGKEYPIRAGIPRFVPGDEYTDSFGFQWNRFSDVQLDSANGGDYSRQRFLRETGWSREDLEGRWVLDGGCGCGRFAEIAADLGGRVVALDYSSAVDAAARNLARFPNVHYVQADLLRPPFRIGSLDLVYSIGVLQHTPDPAAALANCVRLLAPRGRFAFTVYARRWYTRFYSKYWFRPVTRRMRPEALLHAIDAMMPVAFPVTDLLFRLPLLGRVAQFVIPVANYVDKTRFTREQRYQEAILDTFDMLSPAFDQPMIAPEVEAVLRQEGVTDYRFLNRVPIEVTGFAAGSAPARRGCF